MDGVDKLSLLCVEEFTLLPLNHLKTIEKCIIGIHEVVMKDVDMQQGIDENSIKWLKNLQNKITQNQNDVQLHYKLNSVKSCTVRELNKVRSPCSNLLE